MAFSIILAVHLLEISLDLTKRIYLMLWWICRNLNLTPDTSLPDFWSSLRTQRKTGVSLPHLSSKALNAMNATAKKRDEANMMTKVIIN